MENKRKKNRESFSTSHRKQTITSWEAITKYKATRLSSIIFNLRVHFNIKSVDTRVGKSNFATYVYKGKKK